MSKQDSTPGQMVLLGIKEENQIQQLNLAAMVMENLPAILSSMSYEALTEAYHRISDIQTLQWKVSCSILAEAYYRVSNSNPIGNKQSILKVIASDFGINIQRLYQKVLLWNTFWQDINIKDRVSLNTATYIFEQFEHGEAYFREALVAPNPILAITEAEQKYLDAVGQGETYTVKQFKTDLSLTYKTESERLSQISRKVADLSNTASSLITTDDNSFLHVQTFSKKLKEISDKLSNIGEPVLKEDTSPLADEAMGFLSELDATLQLAIIQIEGLLNLGIKKAEVIEEMLFLIIDQIRVLKGEKT